MNEEVGRRQFWLEQAKFNMGRVSAFVCMQWSLEMKRSEWTSLYARTALYTGDMPPPPEVGKQQGHSILPRNGFSKCSLRVESGTDLLGGDASAGLGKSPSMFYRDEPSSSFRRQAEGMLALWGGHRECDICVSLALANDGTGCSDSGSLWSCCESTQLTTPAAAAPYVLVE